MRNDERERSYSCAIKQHGITENREKEDRGGLDFGFGMVDGGWWIWHLSCLQKSNWDLGCSLAVVAVLEHGIRPRPVRVKSSSRGAESRVPTSSEWRLSSHPELRDPRIDEHCHSCSHAGRHQAIQTPLTPMHPTHATCCSIQPPRPPHPHPYPIRLVSHTPPSFKGGENVGLISFPICIVRLYTAPKPSRRSLQTYTAHPSYTHGRLEECPHPATLPHS